MFHGATDVSRQGFQVLRNRSRQLWTFDCQCFFLKAWPALRMLATEKDPSYRTDITGEWKYPFSIAKLPAPAYRHSTPSASWPWRRFQPLVPKEWFAHASLGSLHFYDVSDHICPPSSATQQGTGVALYSVSSISAQAHLSFFPPHSLELISR